MGWIFWNLSGFHIISNISIHLHIHLKKMNQTNVIIILKVSAKKMTFLNENNGSKPGWAPCKNTTVQDYLQFCRLLNTIWCFSLLIFCQIYCFVKYRVIKYSLSLRSIVPGALQKQFYRRSCARRWMKRAPSVKISKTCQHQKFMGPLDPNI